MKAYVSFREANSIRKLSIYGDNEDILIVADALAKNPHVVLTQLELVESKPKKAEDIGDF